MTFWYPKFILVSTEIALQSIKKLNTFVFPLKNKSWNYLIIYRIINPTKL